jgi:type III restriction enzyme
VVPVARPRRRGEEQACLQFGYEDRSGNTLVNSIRSKVDEWRLLPANKWGVTPETERLLAFWRDRSARELPFFFCQLEAVETIIWLSEVAGNDNDQSNPDPLSHRRQHGDRLRYIEQQPNALI